MACLSGCGPAAAATLGTVAGAAASAAQAGGEVFGLGKLDSSEFATLPDAVTAVHWAARDLSLRPKCDPCHRKPGDSVQDFLYVDEKGSEIGVRIDSRTRTLAQVRIDVGIFGSQATARLFLARLRAHLPAQPNSTTRPSPASSPQDKENSGDADVFVWPRPSNGDRLLLTGLG
jgi:hypothetical protein